MRFHIYIVQPSLSKANASNDILLLLGNVQHYLSTVGNIELKVCAAINFLAAQSKFALRP